MCRVSVCLLYTSYVVFVRNGGFANAFSMLCLVAVVKSGRCAVVLIVEFSVVLQALHFDRFDCKSFE